MRFLVIGLGSMGKRRIRCLKKLGYNDIIGFDIRKDRLNEAQNLYNIKATDEIEKIDNIDAVIVSTPPDKHKEYVLWAVRQNIPVFVEASVILEHSKEIKQHLIKNKLREDLIYPSCTLKFHPVIRDIKKLINSEEWGNFLNFSYHSGQYLPDWHPWESILDFYVSKKETGGAREIVPFELTWLCDIFGYPEDIVGFFGKTINLGCDIDDTYSIIIKFKHGYGTLLVDVVSRYATRNIIINLEYAQITWNWNENFFKLYDARNKRFITFYQTVGETMVGYNKNIIEDMYLEEIEYFIKAIKGEESFPNTLEDDIKILELLYIVEKSNIEE